MSKKPSSVPEGNTKEVKKENTQENVNTQTKKPDNQIKQYIGVFFNGFKKESTGIGDYKKLKKDDKVFEEAKTFFGINHPELLKEFSENYADFFQKEDLIFNISLNNLEESYKNNISKQYNNFDESKLNETISKYSFLELKDIISSKVKLKTFLSKNKIVLDVELDKKNDEKILADIFGECDFKNKLTKDPELLGSIHALFAESRLLQYSDLENIISKLEDKENIKKFIKYFLPNITLRDALRSGVVTEDKKNQLIKDKLIQTGFDDSKINKSLLESFDLNLITIDLTDDKLDIIADKLDEYIKSTDIEKPNSEITLLLNKIVDEVSDDKQIKEENDELNLLTKEEFIKRIETSEEICDDIKKNFGENFKSGKIINSVKKDGGVNVYHYIKSFDSNSATIEDITTPDFKVKKDFLSKNNTNKKFSFKELYYTLKVLSDENTQTKFINESSVKENNLEGEEIENISSQDDLKRYLDEIDPENKDININDISFYIDKTSEQKEAEKKSQEEAEKNKGKKKSKISDLFNPLKKQLFSIKSVLNGKVVLSNNEEFSFKEFAGLFKNHELKRQKTIRNNKDIFENVFNSKELAGKFGDLIYDDEDGKIKHKDKKGDKNDPGIKYLTGKDGKTIEIGGIKDGEFSFKIGKNTPSAFKVDQNLVGNMNYMAYYLKQEVEENNMVCDFSGEIENKETEYKGKKGHRPKLLPVLIKNYFNCLSANEIGKGMDMFTNAVKAKLESNSKYNSAKLAKILGKVLPEDWQITLNQQVLGEQKKLMEATMEELVKHGDKKDIIRHIHKVIKNSKADDPQLEGALMAVVKKFGTLYPGELQEERNTYLWYRALGGKVGDELFTKTKNKCIEENRAFNEEDLIEQLLKRQEDKVNFKKYGFIRRTDINKNYGTYLRIEGVNSAYDSGDKKVDSFSSLEDKINIVAMSGLNGGEYAEGIGALNKIINKADGEASEVNKIIFAITASGIANNIPNHLLNKLLEGQKGWNSPFMIFRFNNSSSDLKVFDDMICGLIDTLPSDVKSKAKSDFKNIKSSSSNQTERAMNFWSSYGKLLQDKMIFKDPYIFLNRNKNPAFNEYYNKLCSWYDNDTFSMGADFFNGTAMGYENGYPMGLLSNKLGKKIVIQASEGQVVTKEGDFVLKEFLKQIDGLKSFKNYKPEELFEVYKELYKKIDLNVKGRDHFKPEFEMGKNLKKRHIDISKDAVNRENTTEYDNFIKQNFDKFMGSPINSIKNETKSKFTNIIS